MIFKSVLFLPVILGSVTVRSQADVNPACNSDLPPLEVTDGGELQFSYNRSTLHEQSLWCRWYINPPTDKQDEHLVIAFSRIELDVNSLPRDMLSINDGADNTILGRFFGVVQNPPILLSNSSSVTVNLLLRGERGSRNTSGFHLSFFLSNNPYAVTACSDRHRPAIIYDLKSPVRSPGYPETFPTNQHCVWHLEAEENHVIILRDIDIILGYCTSNYLVIDAVNENGRSETVARTCQSLDTELYIPSNRAHFTFRSGLNKYGGFSMDYDILSVTELACDSHRQPAVVSLGGVIASPVDDNQNYPAQVACKWLVKAQLNESVIFSFNVFDLDDECSRAYLKITDSFNHIGEVERFYKCGPQYLSPIEINNDNIQIEFRVNVPQNAVKRGFEMSFTTADRTEQACHGATISIESSPGYIVSPNFAGRSPSFCRWQLSAPYSEFVKVYFEQVNLGANMDDDMTGQDCSGSNTLSFYDGYMSELDPLLARLCGSEQPSPLFSSTRHLYVVFKGNDEADKSFKLIYEFVSNPTNPSVAQSGSLPIGGLIGMVVGVLAVIALVTSLMIIITKFRQKRLRGQQQQLANHQGHIDSHLWDSEVHPHEVDMAMTNTAFNFSQPPDYPPDYPDDGNAPPTYHEATSTGHSLVGSAALSSTPAPVLPEYIQQVVNVDEPITSNQSSALPPSYDESSKVKGLDKIMDAYSRWKQYDAVRVQQDVRRIPSHGTSNVLPNDQINDEVQERSPSVDQVQTSDSANVYLGSGSSASPDNIETEI